MKTRGTSNLNFDVNDTLYLVDNNGNVYVTNVERALPLTVRVLNLYKVYDIEKCKKNLKNCLHFVDHNATIQCGRACTYV